MALLCLNYFFGGFMIEWFESDADHWKEVTGKNIPKWKRSAGLDDDGTVFIPAIIASNEMNVMMCTGFDGTDVVTYLNHIYVPADWMAREFPETAEVCATIKRQVLKWSGDGASA
jgi:hypothetical protein